MVNPTQPPSQTLPISQIQVFVFQFFLNFEKDSTFSVGIKALSDAACRRCAEGEKPQFVHLKRSDLPPRRLKIQANLNRQPGK